MRCFSASSLVLVGLSCSLAALATSEKGRHIATGSDSVAAQADGTAEAASLYKKAGDVEVKLQKEVDEMVTQSSQKVKSLKGMLTTNSKSIAALTGLFKEVSRLTAGISEYEAQLQNCKKDLAEVKTQQQAGPANEAFFNSVDSDPLAGPTFLQQKSETALAKAAKGLSLLQRHHHHHLAKHMEEGSGEAASGTEASYASDVTYGLNMIDVGEEDMPSRLQHIDRTRVREFAGMDPLEYGMYDFTGTHGVKIFDHASLDPQVQRKHELDLVNLANQRKYGSQDHDDDESLLQEKENAAESEIDHGESSPDRDSDDDDEE